MQGKKIILGISGSIAAYKAAFLTRLLIKAGAEVRILMTPAAAQFITPLTLSTLSKHPVLTDVQSESGWNNHVELGLWADAVLIAPATANTLARLANGICDNILSAVYLSARCPVYLAPAMDVDMWHHPATQENIRRLQSYGNIIIPVAHGELASGLVGEGRMEEPEQIVAFLNAQFRQQQDMQGLKVLITAGPTYEAIDPVRFIGNRSSGKMGIALAEEAACRGARVTLILGPSAQQTQHPSISTFRVESAQEMYGQAIAQFSDTDVAILAAAVADYRPERAEDRKIKKKSDQLTLQLVPTPDIAASLGRIKKEGQYLIGFALETNDEEANARGKLERKNFDLIVLNSLRDSGAGFQHDTNKISILGRDNKKRQFELKTKMAVAKDIIDALLELRGMRNEE
ncbi:MAG: bifunctional phosphopantothenoylcysteine decarboxylase/phosphopantothenate--cysteine ligase CoaBC [Saprospiraceae bacterium]|nr:bifunctional phosphopantothenoylcysteine decarboxylase/phosphopantothenate--cysteine ligase CoaBC [Lewinella sp.]